MIDIQQEELFARLGRQAVLIDVLRAEIGRLQAENETLKVAADVGKAVESVKRVVRPVKRG